MNKLMRWAIRIVLVVAGCVVWAFAFETPLPASLIFAALWAWFIATVDSE